MIQKLAPELYINTEHLDSVYMMESTDKYAEKHVVIDFGDHLLEVSPDYLLDEIVAAIKDRCYYRQQDGDQAGWIDVCVIHGEISESDDIHNPYRLCVKRSPLSLMLPYLQSVEKVTEVEEERPRTFWDRINGR